MAQLSVDGVLVVGGRSAGARVACRTATALGASGVVALAFPLQPPGGRPSRIDELAGAGVPTLVVQGERDAFGRPADFPRRRGRTWTVHPVPDADHSFRVPKGGSGAAAVAEVVRSVREWVLRRAEAAG
jgi:predicted alpha/beta-hydrolase family hydrolase